MSHINIYKYLDVYFINDLGYKEDVLGQFKMIVGFVGVFTSILMVPLLKKIKAKLQVIAIFQLLSAVLVLICFRGTMFSFLVYLYTYYLVYIIIKTVNLPVEREYVASFAEEENMGRIMGIKQSFLSLSNIIGPILGAFLYHNNRLLVFDFAVLFFIIGFLLIMVNIIIMKKEEKIITED
jgi:predicted MFS family arabinose efflux permease